MIFPIIECDNVIQVNDKFRIKTDKTYTTPDEEAISLIEIEPDTGLGFINVTGATPVRANNWFLDFQYSTVGDKTVTVRVTTDGSPVSVTKTVTVLSAAEDYLYSQDAELVAIESDVLKYVPQGRASFKYVHREAQGQILEWLWTNGYTRSDGSRFQKQDFVDLIEVNYWSRYLTLRLIFDDLSNQTEDIFYKKSRQYESTEHLWRRKSLLKIDVNGDGIQDAFEGYNMATKRLVRE
jgi:hypothetical protein